MRGQRQSKVQPLHALASVVLAGTVGGFSPLVGAQDLGYIEIPRSPLVLKSRGSFYVGGEKAAQTSVEVSFSPALPFRDDQVTINQIYVDYMVPHGATKVSVVLMHGATLSGKTYDTTPDGRMGWYDYFVRQGHPTYVPDQVGRARSGFDQAIFNDVAAGLVAPGLPPRFFRVGDNWGVLDELPLRPDAGRCLLGHQVPCQQARRAFDELSKQGIPDISSGLPSPNPSHKALSKMAMKLDGMVRCF
jgi:hypothetical protein